MDYFTVRGEFSSTITIEKSKFICRVAGVSSEEDAKNFVDRVSKLESGATHNCYAYILNGETAFKFSDDGEPHGTAGQPMLEVLKNRNLRNVIAVVTRYFGGIKLGTGGLSRAYSGAVIDCLNNASVVEMVLSVVYCGFFDYNLFSKISKLFNETYVKPISLEYNDRVKVLFAVKQDKSAPFIDLIISALSGNAEISEIGSDFITF